MDASTGLCLGCARRLDEIVAWASLGEAERRAIVALLPARRASAGRTAASAEAWPPAGSGRL